jgi:hypothetical protein
LRIMATHLATTVPVVTIGLESNAVTEVVDIVIFSVCLSGLAAFTDLLSIFRDYDCSEPRTCFVPTWFDSFC